MACVGHPERRALQKKVERPQGTTFDGNVVAMAREGDVLYAVTEQGTIEECYGG